MGLALGAAVDIARQRLAHAGFDAGPVVQVVGQAAVQGHLHLGAGSLHKLFALTHVDKAAADEIRTGENLSVAAVDGGGHNDDAVLRQVVAVPQDHVATSPTP